jgi:quercetin dioxygenase-like cupin family protein
MSNSESTPSSPAATDWGHNYVDIAAMPWTPSRTPGSVQKTLFSDPVTGMSTVYFKVDPGGVIPLHEHPEVEQTYVLKGRLVDHLGECTAGNYVWRAAGSRHTAYCPDGAEFIVFFMKMPVRLPLPAASTAGSESTKAESGAR